MAYDLKAVLESEVIDKLIVLMKTKDAALEAKIAKLGTRVGAASTYDGLPTVDQNGAAISIGDTATLTQTDGDHPAGLYEWDGNQYVLAINYDALDITSIIAEAKAAADALQVDPATAIVTATEDGKFVTPVQIKEALNAITTRNDSAYHPKGGNTSLATVGKAAEENTDQYVTANQLSATFTQTEINTKYDNL
jgi:hypothetical protein